MTDFQFLVILTVKVNSTAAFPTTHPLHILYMKVGPDGRGHCMHVLCQCSIVCLSREPTRQRSSYSRKWVLCSTLRGARRSLVRDRVEWTNRSTRHCAASGEGTSHQFPVGGERKLASPIGS